MFNQEISDPDASPPEQAADTQLSIPSIHTPLSEVSEGMKAIIVDVADIAHYQRCLELGLVPGVSVRIVKSGDPTILSLQDSRIALSRSFLMRITVAHTS